MQDTIEREYKFAVDSPEVAHGIGDWLRSLGVQIAGQSGFTQRDTYYDSRHLDLIRHRVALRLREGEQGSRLFFKGSPVIDGGLCSRPEIEVPWASEVTIPSKLPDRIRAEVEPFTFSRDLGVLAQLSTDRQRFVLQGGSGAEPPAELVVDNVRVEEALGASHAFTEIELEIPPGSTVRWERLADRLRADLPVNPSHVTKLERALTLMGVEIEAPSWERPSAKVPMKTAAVRVLSRHFGTAQAREAGTRLGASPEDLHRMRVAYRRLQVACKTFDGLFPSNLFGPAYELLRHSREVMGPVRDIDVQLDWLVEIEDRVPEYTKPGLGEVRERLLRSRARAREHMLLWLTSTKRLRGCEVFEGLLEALESDRNGRLMVREVAPGFVIDAARRVFKRSQKAHDDPRPENLHRLRIALKRLRYISEEFVHIYGRLDRVRKHLAQMQDTLGQYCDAESAIKFFIEVAAGDPALSRGGQMTIQALIGMQFARRDKALVDFDVAWKHLSNKKLRGELVQAFV